MATGKVHGVHPGSTIISDQDVSCGAPLRGETLNNAAHGGVVGKTALKGIASPTGARIHAPRWATAPLRTGWLGLP
jgi:hypothetical protein